ncbi:MAG: LOG family protein [Candidatus Wolfebacteria bacterium]|nr:LOG family protein [Candidatus Wolfebacteria bacterium]
MSNTENHRKPKICVSGTAELSDFSENTNLIAEKLGEEIAKQGAILVDGATTGFPQWAAKGAKNVGGFVIGFSPADTEKNHVELFGLPTDYHDMIVYTGFHYSGRNLILTRSSDAVIVGPGRIGTINEFTIAFEDNKPLGILEGDWDTDETFKMLIEKSHRAQERKGKIFFDSDPKSLVEKIIEAINKETLKYE